MVDKAALVQRHQLKAPVQGVIANMAVGLGDEVVAGQVLLLQEAMKMEVPLQAPSAGRISAVFAAVGEVVDEGAVLIELIELIELTELIEPVDPASLRSSSLSLATVIAPETSRSPSPSPSPASRTARSPAPTGADAKPSSRPEPPERPALQRLHQRSALTTDAARPEAVARRHASGLRMARENIAELLDAGSFSEYGALAIAAQRSRRSVEDLQHNTPADGLITGTGLVAGRAVAVMAYDYTVLAGTQGVFNHQKADRLLALCQRQCLPLVLFAEGGGGRPGDVDWLGVAGLDCTTFARLAGLSGQVPTVGIVAGRCFAGNAALLGCCDLIIAVEGASIGMGGPAMIEGGGLGKVEADAVGPVDTLARVGVIDIRAADEAAAVALARSYLALTDGKLRTVGSHADASSAASPVAAAAAATAAIAATAAAAAAAQFLRDAMPPSRNALYEPRRIIEAVLDAGSVIELKREHGTGLVTALARLAGRAVAVAASNPKHLGGALDAPACDKLARFMQLADAHGLPLITFVDTPGFMVGPQSEATAMVRHAARLFVNAAALRVPVASVVLRRGYGLGAMALTAGHFHAPVATCAWPTGEFGGMGLEGAVRLGFRKELEAAAPGEREALFDRLLAQAVAKGEALNMASHLEIDAVIDPADTREWLTKVLASACAAPLPPRRSFIDAW
jgi:acetyl-CoA carboxylase carboxyltransferase component